MFLVSRKYVIPPPLYTGTCVELGEFLHFFHFFNIEFIISKLRGPTYSFFLGLFPLVCVYSLGFFL